MLKRFDLHLKYFNARTMFAMLVLSISLYSTHQTEAAAAELPFHANLHFT